MGTILSFPDLTITATLSGGSWQLPLTNLQNPQLSAVARSTNALKASSTILCDLGAAQAITVVSICAHNLTAAATIQARGYSDSGYTALVTGADTTNTRAWPSGFTATGVANYPKNWTYVFASAKTARYWRIEITDTANPAGYIELGRCWLGTAGFSPALGVSYGMELGYESLDVVEESLGGIPWGEKRAARRSLTATFGTLSAIEKRAALIVQKVLTETAEAFWITDSSAVLDDLLLEAFPCFLKKPSALAYPYVNNNTMPISIIERI